MNNFTAKCNTLNCDGPLQVDDTIVAVNYKRRRLLTAGDDDEVFMIRSFNVMPKTAEHYLIVRNGKYEA